MFQWSSIPQQGRPGRSPSGSGRSKRTLLIALGVAAVFLCCVLLIGVVAVTQFTDLLPTFSALFGPKWSSSDVVPVNADFYTSINPKLQDLSGAKHLVDVYGDALEETGGKEDLLESLEEEYDISFEDDVKPWLGQEIAIAMPHLEEATGYETSDIVVMAATRKRKASDEFLEKLREHLEGEDYEVREESYEGIVYYVQEVESDWETPVVFGTLNDFVVLTTDGGVMEDVIDVSKGDKDALSSDERYTQIVNKLPDDAAAITFYDLEGLLGAVLEGSGVTMPEESMEQLEAFKASGMAVSLKNAGVALDFAVTFDPDALPPQVLKNLRTKANIGRILERVPKDALGFIAAQDLSASWQGYLANMEGNPDVARQLEDLGNELGLELDEDLLSWTTGEYALAVVEAAKTDEFAPPVGVFAIFEVNDQKAAAETMEGLADLARETMYIEFEEEEIDGVEMQVFREAGGVLGYGLTEQYLIIGFAEEALEAGVGGGFDPVSTDEVFRSMREHLPGKNNGYFYINVEKVWKLVYENMAEYDKEYFDEDVRPYLEPVKAMGAAAPVTNPKDGFSQATLFFYVP